MHRDKLAKLAKILALDPNDDAAITKMHAELSKIKTKSKVYYKIKFPKIFNKNLHKKLRHHSYLYYFEKGYVCYASSGATTASFKGNIKSVRIPTTSKTGTRFSLQRLAIHFNEFEDFYKKHDGFKVIECFDSKTEVSYEEMKPLFVETIEAKKKAEEEARKEALYAEIQAKQKEYEALQKKLEALNG